MRASRRGPAMYLYSPLGLAARMRVLHLTLTMYMRPYWRCHVRFCIYWTLILSRPHICVCGGAAFLSIWLRCRVRCLLFGSALRVWGLDMDMELHALLDIS